MKVKTVFMASDPIAIESIKAVRDSDFCELVCIVSNPDRPKGRGNKLSPNPVSAWAIENGIELLRPENSPSENEINRFRELGAEFIVVMAYGKMLKMPILEYGKYPCLNLHASLLPELRGASPIESAIALGKKKTGISLMRIVKEMDAGDVCARLEVDIADDETSQTLREKMSHAAAEIFSQNISSIINSTAIFEKQDSSQATYARKFLKEDLRIDFELTAEEISARVRAFSFGTFELNNEVFKVCLPKVENKNCNAVCGEVLEASAEAGLRVACKNSVITFGMIQKPCAKMLHAKDFFAGNVIEKGTILLSSRSKPILKS